MGADSIPPILLMLSGVVLWLSVTVAFGATALATNGVLLFVVGAVGLVAERALQWRAAVVESRDGEA